MKVRVKDGLALYNSRRKRRNLDLMKPLHYKLLNIQRLGMLLYGGGQDSAKYKSIAVSMNRMMSGAATSIRIEFIEKMSDVLGVDPNFIFGHKSIYDKEFKLLIFNNVNRKFSKKEFGVLYEASNKDKKGLKKINENKNKLS